jgi:hypothetical protein
MCGEKIDPETGQGLGKACYPNGSVKELLTLAKQAWRHN